MKLIHARHLLLYIAVCLLVASASVSGGTKKALDVPYGKHEKQTFDIYWKDGFKNAPIVINVHGGGWRTGDKKMGGTRFKVDFYLSLNCVMASVNYRMLPGATADEMISDVFSAVAHIQKNAAKYGGDPNRIIMIGSSAGAHLSAVVTYCGNHDWLKGTPYEGTKLNVIGWYGDSAPLGEGFRHFEKMHLPMYQVKKGAPPAFMIVGTLDRIVPANENGIPFQKKLDELNIWNRLIIIEKGGHVIGNRMLYRTPTLQEHFKAFLNTALGTDKTGKSGEVIRLEATDDFRKVSIKEDHKKLSGKPSIEKEKTDHKSLAEKELKGFYWMSGGGQMLSAPEDRFKHFLMNFDRNLKTNPFLAGVYLNARWHDINPAKDVYKLERIDAQIALIKKHGLSYHLVVYPGQSTPAFVFEEGCIPFKAIDPNKYRPTHGQELTIPLPWDPVYKTYYYKMLAKLAGKYADDPALNAVTIVPYGFKSSELHLPGSRTDIKKWEQYGNYKQKLEDEAKHAIDRFAEVFPKQQLVLEIGMLVGARRSEQQIRNIIEYGYKKYPERFCLQSDQLNGKFDNSDMFTYRIIMDYKDMGHNGFQSLSAWAHQKSRIRQGSMELAVLNYIKTGAEYWQLWYGDGASSDVCRKLAAILKEAQAVGYNAYLEKLKKEGKYKPFTPPNRR